MAIRFTDGFDLYTSSINDMDSSRGWSVENSSGNLSIATTAGKYGGGALAINNSNTDTVTKVFPSAGSGTGPNTVCFSFLFKTSSATNPSSTVNIYTINSSFDNNLPWSVGIYNTGRVVVFPGSNNSTIGNEDTAPSVDINVCDGLWHHIEVAQRVSNGSGIKRLYVDGVASSQNITGVDTNGVNYWEESAPIDTISFSSQTAQGSTFYIDDLLIYDDSSSGISGDLTYTSNFPLGEVRIETIKPNGAGTNSGWTPLSGANYTNVDENVADDDTSYVTTGTATDLDTYAFGNLAGTPSTVYGVNIGSVGKASPGSSTNIRHYTLSSGTANESADIALSGAYTFNQTFVGQDPNTTAAWTASGINAAEFGIEKQ